MKLTSSKKSLEFRLIRFKTSLSMILLKLEQP